MTLASRAWGVFRKEGVSGVIGRFSYPLAAPPPPPPDLSHGVVLEGDPSGRMVAMLRRFLSDHGVPVRPDDPATPRLHVGLEPDRLDRLRPHDILFMDRGTPADLFARAVERVGLIVDHDPARIALLAGRARGCPHLMVVPPPPEEAAGAQAWDDYAARAQFGLRRVLLMGNALSAERMDYAPHLGGSACAVSLPETPLRRQAFRSGELGHVPLVDGLKRHPAWLGAASTYRQLAQAALSQGKDHLLIVQDDAVPGPDFPRRFAVARDYMRESEADMFAGLVSDVDDSFEVRRVVQRDGVQFLHLNKSVGLVFNIFGPRMLRRLSDWDEAAGDVRTNTIDRFLSRTEGVDVVTCLPYLVDHRDDHRSSVWNFDNGRYRSLIRASERKLARMAGLGIGGR